MPRDWLKRTSKKWPILCQMGRKTLTQSINYRPFIGTANRIMSFPKTEWPWRPSVMTNSIFHTVLQQLPTSQLTWRILWSLRDSGTSCTSHYCSVSLQQRLFWLCLYLKFFSQHNVKNIKEDSESELDCKLHFMTVYNNRYVPCVTMVHSVCHTLCKPGDATRWLVVSWKNFNYRLECIVVITTTPDYPQRVFGVFFITVQNLVGIHNVVLIMYKCGYFMS